jgi:hypothetical protein
LTTTEYPNSTENSTAGPDLAFVACSDPETVIRAMAERSGVPMHQTIFLSLADDPSLGTPEAIFAALPSSITWLFLWKVEFLLPASRRNRSAVHSLMAEIGRMADQRDIVVNATHGLGSPSSRVISVHPCSGDRA